MNAETMMPLLLAMTLLLLVASPAHARVFWDYEGKNTGQDSWSEVSPEFALCNTGSNQSPVAIGSTRQKKLPALEFHYQPANTTLTLDRYSVVAKPATRMFFSEQDEDFTLTEMLVRSPSEHEVLGVFYPMELQLFHTSREEKQTAIAIFVTMGEYNAAMQPLIENYPAKLGDKPGIALEWQKLLPEQRGYFAYRGSISTPPCTENIHWRVFKKPITISREQAEQLAAKIGRNSRAAQPLMLRTVFESEE